MVKWLCLSGLGVLLLAGCQSAQDDGITRYHCGSYHTEINTLSGKGTVRNPEGTSLGLTQVAADSGIRFEGSNPKIAFWDKDGQAALFIAEKELIPCVSTQERMLMEGLREKQRQQEQLDLYRMHNGARSAIPR